MSTTDEQITARHDVRARRRGRRGGRGGRGGSAQPATLPYIEAEYIPTGTADLWRARRRDARR